MAVAADGGYAAAARSTIAIREKHAWTEEPNDGFDGSTPLQVVERGEVDRVWQMIFAIRTGHPM